jgi:hypothetical protein
MIALELAPSELRRPRVITGSSGGELLATPANSLVRTALRATPLQRLKNSHHQFLELGFSPLVPALTELANEAARCLIENRSAEWFDYPPKFSTLVIQEIEDLPDRFGTVKRMRSLTHRSLQDNPDLVTRTKCTSSRSRSSSI